MSAVLARVSVCAVVGLLASAASALNIATVTVGNPANPSDTQVMNDGTTGYGSVAYTYQMGKYDVTAGQYCEFLNAVARTDPYALYSPQMGNLSFQGCNIQRGGSSGTYAYSVPSDWANRPVNCISYGDAARFANWLTNGQPTTGMENASTTEDGSYAVYGALSASALLSITRKPNAKWVIPSENEWYKAAYYDPNKLGGPGYWAYATRSNAIPSNVLSSTGTNNANYEDVHGTGNGGYTIGAPYYRTEVGAFASSPSAYGTYDQAGNIWQWNETSFYGQYRGLRGGSYSYDDLTLRAAHRDFSFPEAFQDIIGFRVAEVPDPATLLLALAGAGLLTRRRRARD